jgi:preprotein translocase subunit SecG
MNVLAQMTWGESALTWLLILVCCFLILVILLQRGRGGGLSGAFGGVGGSSAFGAKTGDVFTWITVVVAALYVLLNVVDNYALDKTPGQPGPAAAATSAEPETPSETPSTEGEPGAAITMPIGETTGETPPAAGDQAPAVGPETPESGEAATQPGEAAPPAVDEAQEDTGEPGPEEQPSP